MPVHEHVRVADRLIRAAQTADPTARVGLIAEAQARATLALAEETHLGNLIAAAALYGDDANDRLEHPLAALILRRMIRRRLGILPPLTVDGRASNGGS